ncbi:MAG: MFS transporter [Blastocatellia bacterium]
MESLEALEPPDPIVQSESEPPEENRATMFSALRHRDYRLLWLGVFCSGIGTWMQVVAQGWLVRDLTPSPFLIGFVSFAGSLPVLLLSLFSGVFVDTFDRRRLLMATQVAQLLFSVVLGLLVSLQAVTIWQVILLSFLGGVAISLSNPTYYALMHDIVGRDDLMSAISLNSTQYNLSRIIGPAIGGLMITAVGMAGCFYLNGFTFLAMIAALLMMRVVSVGQVESAGVRDVLPQTLAGLRYVRRRPRVLAILSIAAVVSTFGIPFLVFLPVFARDVLGKDALGLSWLMAATGAGAVVSALSQTFLSNYRRRGMVLLLGATAFGVATVAFALSQAYVPSLFYLAALGGAMVSVTTNTNNLLQTLVRDEMRGRVMSMYTLIFMGLPPLGALLVGALADLTGKQGSYHGAQLALAVSGLVVLLFAVSVALAVPRLRALE